MQFVAKVGWNNSHQAFCVGTEDQLFKQATE
jgi:hypothetical protein